MRAEGEKAHLLDKLKQKIKDVASEVIHGDTSGHPMGQHSTSELAQGIATSALFRKQAEPNPVSGGLPQGMYAVSHGGNVTLDSTGMAKTDGKEHGHPFTNTYVEVKGEDWHQIEKSAGAEGHSYVDINGEPTALVYTADTVQTVLDEQVDLHIANSSGSYLHPQNDTAAQRTNLAMQILDDLTPSTTQVFVSAEPYNELAPKRRIRTLNPLIATAKMVTEQLGDLAIGASGSEKLKAHETVEQLTSVGSAVQNVKEMVHGEGKAKSHKENQRYLVIFGAVPQGDNAQALDCDKVVKSTEGAPLPAIKLSEHRAEIMAVMRQAMAHH
jgi:hypothetical protein